MKNYCEEHGDKIVDGKCPTCEANADQAPSLKQQIEMSEARAGETLKRILNNPLVKATLLDSGISTNDLHSSIRSAVAALNFFKGEESSSAPVAGPWVADIIAPLEEKGEQWDAVVEFNSKLYCVNFEINDGKAVVVDKPKEVQRTTDYEYIGAMEKAAKEVVKSANSFGVLRCREYGFALFNETASDKHPRLQIVRARKTWETGKEISFQWMPGGKHTITASYGKGDQNRPIRLTVDCNKAGAERVGKELERIRAENPRRPPFICIEHEAKERAGNPLALEWKDGDPEPGIYCTHEPSKLGAESVNGRTYTSFSPTFDTDAEYSKMQCSGCRKGTTACKCDDSHVWEFPEGVRGSESNPAELTRLDSQSIGSLTNWNAFKDILPVSARDATNKDKGLDTSVPKEESKEPIDVIVARAGKLDRLLDTLSERLKYNNKPKPTLDAILARNAKLDEVLAHITILPTSEQSMLDKLAERNAA